MLKRLKLLLNNSFFVIKYKCGDSMNLKDFNFKKKLGQNFLIDNNILMKIVKSADIANNSLVIEIGCGSGNLTKHLCEISDFVLGYEIDLGVKDYLFDNLKKYNNYEIVFDDFLKRDLHNDVEKYNYENIYVIANVPYYITTPIIEKIIDSGIKTNNIILMVQKEVGERFTSLPGGKDYGSITVFLNYYYDISKLFIVSRNNFVPKPNVDSIVISLKSKDRLFVKDEKLFFKLVRDSFQFRRKTIRNNLKDYNLEIIESVLRKYGFDLNVRSECLGVDVFCDISNSLSI